MNILFPFTGDTVGGSHLSALALIKRLPEKGIQPRIVLHQKGGFADYLAERNIDHDFIGTAPVSAHSLHGQLFGMTRTAIPLARRIRRDQIDIVHTNDARMHLTWSVAARLAGRRHVWHQRSADDSRRLGLLSRPANAVVTISDYCRERFDPGLGQRAQVIYDPFDTEAPSPDRHEARHRLAEALGVEPDVIIIGFVGNLTRQKRPLVFVDLAARLKGTAQRPVIFAMIGALRSRHTKDVRARINATGIDDSFFLLGPQFPIESWIAGFDILVAPAVNEGLGRTLIEAALVGTPVIAADHGGHREAIEDGVSGRLVPADDPAAFAAAVNDILDNPQQSERFANAARERARARFATAAHVDAICDIYRSVLP